MCGIVCMPTERRRPMTILDPISGNRVTISASVKPRGLSTESGLEVRHAVLPTVAETKEGRRELSLARNRAGCRTVGENPAG
jgi:hypothetical protein